MTTDELIKQTAETLGIDAQQIELEYIDGKLHIICSGVSSEDFDDDDGGFEDDEDD